MSIRVNYTLDEIESIEGDKPGEVYYTIDVSGRGVPPKDESGSEISYSETTESIGANGNDITTQLEMPQRRQYTSDEAFTRDVEATRHTALCNMLHHASELRQKLVHEYIEEIETRMKVNPIYPGVLFCEENDPERYQFLPDIENAQNYLLLAREEYGECNMKSKDIIVFEINSEKIITNCHILKGDELEKYEGDKSYEGKEVTIERPMNSAAYVKIATNEKEADGKNDEMSFAERLKLIQSNNAKNNNRGLGM